MKTWITSDTHFGHSNIMNFCPETRGRFQDKDHMNREMIKIWNAVVGQEDLVYHLGDVSFLNVTETCDIVENLNGRKILITGNHDGKLLKKQRFRDCFEEIHDYLEITHKNKKVILFHYPIHMHWNSSHYGSVHFYGHVHGNQTGLEEYRARDVGFDATGNVVTLLDSIFSEAVEGKIAV